MPKHIVMADAGDRPDKIVFDSRSAKLTAFHWHGSEILVERVEKRWTASRQGLLQTFYLVQTPLGRFHLIFHIHPRTRQHVWYLHQEQAG